MVKIQTQTEIISVHKKKAGTDSADLISAGKLFQSWEPQPAKASEPLGTKHTLGVSRKSLPAGLTRPRRG